MDTETACCLWNPDLFLFWNSLASILQTGLEKMPQLIELFSVVQFCTSVQSIINPCPFCFIICFKKYIDDVFQITRTPFFARSSDYLHDFGLWRSKSSISSWDIITCYIPKESLHCIKYSRHHNVEWTLRGCP